MFFILMSLISADGFAIGIGAYPNGLISFKFCGSPQSVLQLTVGTSAWYTHHGYWRTGLTVGGRALFAMQRGGTGVGYIHFLGAGAGIHSWTSDGSSSIGVVGEGFYEFELFPNPDELPLSLEIGVGVGIVSEGLWLFIPLGIHFYFK